MTHRTRVAVGITSAVLGAGLVAVRLGAWTWDRTTSRMVDRVLATDRGVRPESFDTEMLSDLPAPVARYFHYALTPGQPLVRTARIEHVGAFRTSPDASWSRFHSVQYFSAEPPGFVWNATIDMVPLVGVRVRDSYFAGEAAMLGKVGVLIPVVNQQGTRELASGALHRYLAESVWFPTALLPREGLVWEAVDDSTARVKLTDAGITVSLDVHFAASGEIIRVTAERYRTVDGLSVPTPFVGHFRDYREHMGVRIPMNGEVEWILPEGRFSYWRGRVERIDYGFGDR